VKILQVYLVDYGETQLAAMDELHTLRDSEKAIPPMAVLIEPTAELKIGDMMKTDDYITATQLSVGKKCTISNMTGNILH